MKLRLRHHILILALFCALALGTTYPIMTAPGSLFGNSADPLLIAWQLESMAEKFSHGLGGMWESNIFYPNEHTYLYTEHMLGFGLLAWPIIAVTDNPILAYNLLMVLSMTLTGWVMVLIVRQWISSLPLAIAAAITFVTTPFFFVHFYQLHVGAFLFLALAFLFFLRWLRDGEALSLVCFLFFMIVEIASSGNLSFMILPPLAVTVAVWMALDPTHRTKKRRIHLGWAACALFAALALFYGSYFLVQIERPIGEMMLYSMTLRDYVLVSPWIVEWGWMSPSASSERYFFVGVVPFLGILSGIVLLIKRFRQLPERTQKEAFALAVFLLAAAFLSLGPEIQITDGVPTIGGPYSLLSFLPGYQSLRSLGRASIFVLFVSVLLASIGWGSWFDRRRGLRAWAASAIVGAAVIAELVLTPFVPIWVEKAPAFKDLPPVYHWLEEHRSDYTMIELPIGKNTFIEGSYTYASAFHGMKMVNGYSGHFPDTFQEAMRIMPLFPSDASIEFLRALNVDLVVLHKDFLSAEEWERITSELARIPLPILYHDQDRHDMIVDVRPSPL